MESTVNQWEWAGHNIYRKSTILIHPNFEILLKHLVPPNSRPLNKIGLNQQADHFLSNPTNFDPETIDTPFDPPFMTPRKGPA